MGTKFGLLLGLGAGYVSDVRAGHEQYERVRPAAPKVRRFPVAAGLLDSAGEKVSNMVHVQGEYVTDKVADAMKKHLFGTPATPCEVDLHFEDEGPNGRWAYDDLNTSFHYLLSVRT